MPRGRSTPGAGGGLGGAYDPVPLIQPPPPILPTGGIPQPGQASVPYEPGMGSGPGGTGAPTAPQPPAGGDTGGGGGGGSDIDWADVYFGQYGLPSDLKAQIESLGQKYGTTNPDVFFQAAQNLIRQSDWFTQTYPGFFAGVRAGLFTDETGYRSYVNQLNTSYQQYAGRAVTGGEVASALAEGITPDIVGRRFAADAYLKANTNDIQQLAGAFGDTGALSGDELQAYGREQAGIDSPLGQQVQRKLDLAKQRFQSIFQGRLATPAVTLSGGNSLSAPGLRGQNQRPDIAA